MYWHTLGFIIAIYIGSTGYMTEGLQWGPAVLLSVLVYTNKFVTKYLYIFIDQD